MILGLLGVVVLATILELAVDYGLVMELVVPRPSDAIIAFPPVQEEMDLFGNFFVTLGMTAAATGLALAIGIPFGYFLYRNSNIFKLSQNIYTKNSFLAKKKMLFDEGHLLRPKIVKCC